MNSMGSRGEKFSLIPYEQSHSCRGARAIIGVNLTLIGRLKPQLHKQNLPGAGLKTLDFTLVRAGGLGFYSRDFQDAVGEFGKPNPPDPHSHLRLPCKGRGRLEAPLLLGEGLGRGLLPS